jgi:uncharacterized damage-inducible protein DinB
MTSADLLVDAFGRIREAVHDAVRGLTQQQLAHRVDPDANSIAWLVWHLTRVQDDHVAELIDPDDPRQVWLTDGWAQRFGLPFDPAETGYAQDSADVAALAEASAELLLGYHDAVSDRTVAYVRDLTDADLPRVVDTGWDPPVTLAVRLISVITDDLMHAGQAQFLHGVVR